MLLHAIDKELKNQDIKNVDIVYGAKISGYELPQTSDQKLETVVKMNNGDAFKCQLLVSKQILFYPMVGNNLLLLNQNQINKTFDMYIYIHTYSISFFFSLYLI